MKIIVVNWRYYNEIMKNKGFYIFWKFNAYYITERRKNWFEGIVMEVLFSIIGITLSCIATFTLIRSIILNKAFIIKKAKVIGFDAYTYLSSEVEYNTMFYTIIEVEDENKKIKIAISPFENNHKLERDDEIEVMYPKGNIEKIKVYSKEDKYNFYYLTIIIGILITALSITII